MDRRVEIAIRILSDVVTGRIGDLPARSDIDRCEILEKLAKVVNLSRSRLRALFKSETGMTPAQYLKQIKMKMAKDLAENSNLSIGEIMVSIGVSDESHFRRDFKNKYGVTLTESRILRYQQLKDEQQSQKYQIDLNAQSNRPENSQIGQ